MPNIIKLVDVVNLVYYNMNKEELNKYIVKSDQRIMSLPINLLPIGLFDGKMGLCIYFFHKAQLHNNSQYRSFAEKLLNDIYGSIGEITTIDFNIGISGIAWGVHYIADMRFVTGNIDNALREVDDLLFRIIHSEWLEDKKKTRKDFLWLLFYYSDRLRTINNKIEKNLAQRTVIQIINHIEDNFSDSLWEEPRHWDLENYELPLYLLVLSRFYSMGFYNYKILKIWEGLAYTVLSFMSVRHGNRFVLLSAIQVTLKCISLPRWEEHVELLRQNIDHERILNQEFLNKNITLRRGLAGYCLLLSLRQEGLLPSCFKKSILERIEQSEIWDGRFNPQLNAFICNVGLVNGYAGVSLIYEYLLKNADK